MNDDDMYVQRTRTAFLWTTILGVPFWALYALLLFILYKDLHATPLQIALFITLRPLVSIFSLYWSARVNRRRDRLRSNVVWAGILGPLPFLFLPIIDNVWFVIGASALYMTLIRGVFPAWMEILKLNLPSEIRQQIVSQSTTYSYVGGALLSLPIGWLMDDYGQIWRWIFPVVALMSMFSACLQARIPIRLNEVLLQSDRGVLTFRQSLIQPWKSVWELLRRRPDFWRFQSGFMLGGFGLVIIQPALPQFFISVLHLSYIELTTALTLCKGVAFAFTSSSWARWLPQVNIYRFSSIVALLAALFPLLVIGAQTHLLMLFTAYLLYGVMQSGSELCWHLSGPLFAKGEDSSVYSSVNLAVIGLRGCVAPLLGGLLLEAFSPAFVLILGSVLAGLASWRLHSHHRQVMQVQTVS